MSAVRRVNQAVTVAGSRFKAGPHQYIIQPPYGDGTTRYNSRKEALAAYDKTQQEDQRPYTAPPTHAKEQANEHSHC